MTHRAILVTPDDYWTDGESVPESMARYFDSLSRASRIARLHETIASMDGDIRIAERHGIQVSATRAARSKCFALLAELVNP